MTRLWKTVLLVILIVPLMLLVGAATWYARAQAPQGLRDAVVRPPEAAKKQLIDLPTNVPAGGVSFIRDDVGDSRLKELREKAALAELRSIERASVIRERLNQSEGVGDAEVKKALRTELRAAVLEAFKARQDLHAAEVAALERKAQAMKQSLTEREARSANIIDRRVDELLNPDNQWNAIVPPANAPSSEVTAAEPSPPAVENKLLVRRSETSVKVEGRFDGNEEIVLVIGDPRFTAIANTAQELKDVKEMKWTNPVNKAGEYMIEVRRDVVKIDGGGTAPGLVFEVHNVPNTVQGTSFIAFTDKDPLPNGKVVIAVPTTKLQLKRKTDQVLVTVGHVELPGATDVVPINIVIRRRAEANSVNRAEQPVNANGTLLQPKPPKDAGQASEIFNEILDRKNARAVVETYVAAALVGRIEKAASLAKSTPAVRNQIESLSKQLNIQRLVINSVYVNDPAKPTTALATSEAVKLTKKQPNGQGDGVLVLTLTMSSDGWSVTDIDFESKESAEVESRRFREAHPNAVLVPPLKANVLPGTDSSSHIAPQAAGKQNVVEQLQGRWMVQLWSQNNQSALDDQEVEYAFVFDEGRMYQVARAKDGEEPVEGSEAKMLWGRVEIQEGHDPIWFKLANENESVEKLGLLELKNGILRMAFKTNPKGISSVERAKALLAGVDVTYVECRKTSVADKEQNAQRPLPGDTAAKLVARLQGRWKVKFADIGGLTTPDLQKSIVVRDRLLLLSLVAEGDVESISSWRLSWPDENRPDEVDVTFDPNSGVLPAQLGRIECDGKTFRLCFNDGTSKAAKRPIELCPGESVCYIEGTKDVRTENITEKPTGKQLGIVLGKPIQESDLNKNTSTGDNLKRLLFQPLTEHYCRQHKLDRADELQTKIKDEKRRAMARLFVLPAELHRHLFEKHGGRVLLSAFGPIPVDALKKWFEEREQAGEFEITDPELKAKYRELWMQEPAGAPFASPDEIKAAFDPAQTDRFIENFGRKPAAAETEVEDKPESQPKPKPQDKLPDEKANDLKSEAQSANGQTTIAIGQISYSLPFNFPSVESILRHLPEGKARPRNERIQCELVKYQVSDPRHYPLVGPAQLVQAHFKSTLTSDAGREVVYSDTSHLIRVSNECASMP